MDEAEVHGSLIETSIESMISGLHSLSSSISTSASYVSLEVLLYLDSNDVSRGSGDGEGDSEGAGKRDNDDDGMGEGDSECDSIP